MELVLEPDCDMAQTRTDENEACRIEKPSESEDLPKLDEAPGSAEPEAEPIEIDTPRAVSSKRKWLLALQRVDPVFYLTWLVSTLLLIIGFYWFVEHNNRLVTAHLQEIEAGRKELNEKRSDTLQSDKPALLQGDLPLEPPSAAVLVVTPPELAQEIEVKSESRESPAASSHIPVVIAENPEVVELKVQLEEKAQQLEVLALENYELRLRLEFDQPPAPDEVVEIPTAVSEHGEMTSSVEAIPQQDVTELPSRNLKSFEPAVVPGAADATGALYNADRALANRDYIAAEKWYRLAVQYEPDNREANLGVASVALRNENTQLAVERYRHLLSIYPEDQTVFSAMLKLADTDSEIENELRSLAVRSSEDQAALYLILGHHFGRTGRWPEANDAFVAALKSAPEQPAAIFFNLAVSFEHLGQTDVAVDHYRRSLKADNVAGSSSADRILRFDRARAESRLAELTE